MTLTQAQVDKLRWWQRQKVPGGLLYIDSATEDLFKPSTMAAILFGTDGFSTEAVVLRDGEMEAL